MEYLNLNENIVAQATATGAGSVDIVRISGENLVQTYLDIFRVEKGPKPNTIQTMTFFKHESNTPIDHCLVSYFKSPLSFTGQDIIEINCHGGGVTAKKIIKEVMKRENTRSALPGEFLFRAYINKKIDLAQAEATNELILADSDVEREKNLENVGGQLSRKIKEIKEKIINLMTIIEHELDFDESEIEHITNNQIRETLQNVLIEIREIKDCYYFSNKIKNGIRVMLLGKPNAGKSSIYNALLGTERSIVTNIPGTTRDTVESILEIKNHKVVLIDTAGTRKASNKVEQMGVDKTMLETKLADIVLLVVEKKTDLDSYSNNKKTIKILSKSDINREIEGCISVCSINGDGVHELSTAISTEVSSLMEKKNINNKYLINERQRGIIKTTQENIEKTILALDEGCERDILADMIHLFLEDLNNIVHPTSSEEIINNIFAGFCVGK